MDGRGRGGAEVSEGVQAQIRMEGTHMIDEESVLLVATEHEDGEIDLHFTTVEFLEKEWLEDFIRYQKNSGEKWTSVCEHIRSRGFSWFETKYRNFTMFPIASLREAQSLISELILSPDPVCRSAETVPTFHWKKEETPPSLYPRLTEMGILPEYPARDL
jgi:hypothetical protein